MKTTPSPRNTPVSPFQRWLVLGVAVVITIASGVMYGSYSQRWGPPADLDSAATQLATMPRTIGKWTLAEENDIDGAAVEMLQCAGYVNRIYVHQETGQTISVAIIVGPPGPTAVHTPEICFSSRAYDEEGSREAVSMTGSASRQHSFWRVDFSTKNVMASKLRVYYAWSRGPFWEASESPRYQYGPEPLLYKIQLAAPLPPRVDSDSEDVGLAFLEQLTKSGWELSSD